MKTYKTFMEALEEDYVITVKGKEVSRHKTESEARSAWHKLRKKHSSAQNGVKVVKEIFEKGI